MKICPFKLPMYYIGINQIYKKRKNKSNIKTRKSGNHDKKNSVIFLNIAEIPIAY